MQKVALTDRYIKTRKAAAPGKRDDHHDALVPGLALRVTDKGHKSFILLARFPSRPKNTTRRALGEYGALTLDDARNKARTWLEMIHKGLDPAAEAAKKEAAARVLAVNTFPAVIDEYMKRPGARLAKAEIVRRILTAEFVKPWTGRAITDIKPVDVAAAVRAIVDRGAPYQAHNAYAFLRRVFNWAVATHEFGLERSPCEGLRPTDLIGEREVRVRVLTAPEVRAVWGACDALAYPFGSLVRLLLLTGQRLREVGEATWSEIDLDARLWTIPAHRMKGRRVQTVPLAPDALALLQGLPRFAGAFVFTTTSGARPISGYGKAKARLDRLTGVSGWAFHDLRRTMRTGLSALPVQDLVRELVIAHARPELHQVYDQYSFLDEKREALELWEQRLRSIVG